MEPELCTPGERTGVGKRITAMAIKMVRTQIRKLARGVVHRAVELHRHFHDRGGQRAHVADDCRIVCVGMRGNFAEFNGDSDLAFQQGLTGKDITVIYFWFR